MYPPCRRQSTERNFLRTQPFPRTPRLDCRAKSADFPVYASNSRAASLACVKPADSSSPLQQIHPPPRRRTWRRLRTQTQMRQYFFDHRRFFNHRDQRLGVRSFNHVRRGQVFHYRTITKDLTPSYDPFVLSRNFKPELKRALWGGGFWSDGYYVATVGERGDWSVVERYVKNQGNPKDDLRQFKFF